MSGLAAAILTILVRHGVPEVLIIGLVVLFGPAVGTVPGTINISDYGIIAALVAAIIDSLSRRDRQPAP